MTAQSPYVLLSCAMSIDGFLDDASPDRLLLSNDEDFDRVDAVRAGCDAILVGANTIRRDDPRLLVRGERRRAERLARGLPQHPLKVTLTTDGDLDPRARFFTAGDAGDGRLVYCPDAQLGKATARLGHVATVVGAGDPLDLRAVLADLAGRGVRRLMVEGGGSVHTQFLAQGLADELHLVIAPFFVGDPDAPRFVAPASSAGFPHGPHRPLRLAGTRRLGDCVLLRYVTDPHRHWLHEAIALSRSCPPSPTAFSVGAIVVAEDGTVLATGYSRETDPRDHAEEAALAKLAPGDPRLRTATLYTSLEPCTTRASRPTSCTRLILNASIPAVVFAWREPSLFADGDGTETLRAAGVTVTEIPALADLAREVNAHLPLR